MLFVSHNMEAITNLTSTSLLLQGGSVATLGDTSEVIFRYLQLASLEAESGVLNASQRSGHGPIRFTQFHCETAGGQQVNHLMSGEQAAFVIGYETTPPQVCRKPEVTLIVSSAGGTQLFNASNMYFDGQPFERIPTSGQFVCVIPRLPLRAGDYLVDLYCSVDGPVSDWLVGAARFAVSDGDFYGTGKVMKKSTGITFVDHIWKLRDACVDLAPSTDKGASC